MHIRFADVDDQFIKEQVQNGFYTNETELVRDAVRRMREEKERDKRFQNAVAQGLQAIERGETSPLSKDLLRQLKDKAIQNAIDKKPFHSAYAIPPNLEA